MQMSVFSLYLALCDLNTIIVVLYVCVCVCIPASLPLTKALEGTSKTFQDIGKMYTEEVASVDTISA